MNNKFRSLGFPCLLFPLRPLTVLPDRFSTGDIPKSWMYENNMDTISAYGHDGYFGMEMYYIPDENITFVSSKG